MSLRFDHHRLANGLTIIGEHNPQAQSVAAGYFVNTGSRDEAADVAGVSHFLEHMMFKGTARRSAEDINREFDELGANYNAYTSEERTVYYGAVLAERTPSLIDLLTDMMRPALRESDFELEKNVILEEIAMYDDRPNFKVFEKANARFFNGHPLGNSVLGSQDSIKALSRQQMAAYFAARYAPNNMVFSIAGNYDWQAVLAQLTALTDSWQPQPTSRQYPAFAPATGRSVEREQQLKRAHVALYAPGVSAQDELRYAAALLASCLGDSSGSRLYWSLVDKGLADSASLSHDSGDGIGAFIGYLSTDPATVGAVLEQVEAVLAAVYTVPISEAEWRRAQRKLATALTLRGETPYGRLMSFGATYLYTQQYQSVADVVARLLATDLTQLERLLAKRPFDQLYTLVLSP
jgi:predicted Zn-dependent peptidase